jgi:hypothetical protein
LQALTTDAQVGGVTTLRLTARDSGGDAVQLSELTVR